MEREAAAELGKQEVKQVVAGVDKLVCLFVFVFCFFAFFVFLFLFFVLLLLLFFWFFCFVVVFSDEASRPSSAAAVAGFHCFSKKYRNVVCASIS